MGGTLGKTRSKWDGNRNQLFKACERLYNLSLWEDLDELSDEDYFVASLCMDVAANSISLLAIKDSSRNLTYAVNLRTIWEALALLRLYDEGKLDAGHLRLFRAQSRLFFDDFFLKIGQWSDEPDEAIKRDHKRWVSVLSKELGIPEELAESIHSHEFLFLTKDPNLLAFNAFNLMNAVCPEKGKDYKELCVFVHPFCCNQEFEAGKLKWFSGLVDNTLSEVAEYLLARGLYQFGPKEPSVDSIANKATKKVGRHLRTLSFASQSLAAITCSLQENRKLADFDLREAETALKMFRQMCATLSMGFPHETLLVFKGFVEHMAVWDKVSDERMVEGFKAYTDARFLANDSEWDANNKALAKVFEEYYSKAYREGKTEFVDKMRNERLHFLSEEKMDYIGLAGDYISAFVKRLVSVDSTWKDKRNAFRYLLLEYKRSVKYSHGRGYLLAFKDCWSNVNEQLELFAAQMICDKLQRIAERVNNKDSLVEFSLKLFWETAINFRYACDAFKDNDIRAIKTCEERDDEINRIIDSVADSLKRQQERQSLFDNSFIGS